MKDFIVKFSLSDSEYMTALRLAVGAVCAAGDTDVDGAEDMKVCVTESCLILKSCGFESVEVTLGCKGGVCATVKGEGGNPAESDSEFSLALVSALVSSCVLEREQGAISKIILKL
ncbi:MAG: hypothetical protein K2L72_01615 [Clostridia bacterium]|nr:hypothetical protein [Clostridia bacterium]